MSRSRKNWNHLVDETGNYYDISSSQGVKGRKGERGLTGAKGDDGRVGQKGVKGDEGPAGPVFIWKGTVPSSQDLPIALRGTNGWTYQAEDTGFFHVSNGDRSYSVIETLDLIKGDAGDRGVKGDEGDKGDEGEKGGKGEKGDPFTFADFTESQKEELKGEPGPQGEGGEKGDPLSFDDLDADQKEELKGEKGSPSDGAIPEVPNNNNLYLRQFNNWVSSARYRPQDSRTGLNINSVTGYGNPSYSVTNPLNRKYAFAVGSVAEGNSYAWTSFYILQDNHNCFARQSLYVKSFAENQGNGQEVAVKANLRSMRTALRQAISDAVDFDDLKSKLLTRLDLLEAEFQDADPNEPASDPAN